jgi:P-type conjugative transfer protein TrbJ
MTKRRDLLTLIPAAFLALTAWFGGIQTAQAQWVVIDPANVLQTTLVDLQQVESYAQQIQQYETQIQQYENMIQNTANAPFELIQQAQAVIFNLVNAINTLSQLESKFGSLTGYLNQFSTLSTYKTNACFERTGCQGGALVGLQQTNTLASQTQFNAVNASFQNINNQQQQIQTDASNLQTLQTNAVGATGQMQALQYGNQLAAATAAQLLQIRALLISEQNMLASMNQASQNINAQQQASNTQFHTLTPQQTPANGLNASQWTTY